MLRCVLHLMSALFAVALLCGPIWAQSTDFLFGLTVHGLPVTQNQILDQEAEVKVPVRLVTLPVLYWIKLAAAARGGAGMKRQVSLLVGLLRTYRKDEKMAEAIRRRRSQAGSR